MSAPAGLTRRGFLARGGVLVAAALLPRLPPGLDAAPVDPPARWPELVPPEALASWIAIEEDGTVTAAVGKIEAGMGISTAFAQIVADELDAPFAAVSIRMGDTARTVDQRGTGSSNGIVQGGAALRRAAAQARQALLALAAEHLATPVEELTVADGVVQVVADPARTVAYGTLVAGRALSAVVDPAVPVKSPLEYRLVGHAVPRTDLPPKAAGTYEFLVNLRLPGMLHGAVIRPPAAGCRLIGVDSFDAMPGLVRVVTRGDFVGVVCEREEQARDVARGLGVRWTEPEARFPADADALYRHLREAPVVADDTAESVGEVGSALAQAARSLEAVYEYPFQSHACMGPACGVADVRTDAVTVWMGGQKPYPLRSAVAEMLNRPLETVRVIWLPGPGSYGMNDADDAAMDAVVLSATVGRPVRVQHQRADATAWDPKGPPASIRVAGGLDADGRITVFDWESRAFSARIRNPSTSRAGDSLAGELIGGFPGGGAPRFTHSQETYIFPHKRRHARLIDWGCSRTTGLRTSHLRDPVGPAACFASESFIDELAAAAGRDPVALRLEYLADARDRAVVAAAAERAGWQARPSPQPRPPDANHVCGRGIAYAPRNGATVAMVAEVEVELATGRYRVTRFVVAHDCGFVVNPLNLRGTIEANVIQAMSRALHEEVRFDATHVRSVDWLSYPILDITEVPDAIDIVVLNNTPTAPPRGAGEPATRPVAAAIANALFDATGVRLRRVPLRPADLLAGLNA